MLLSVLLPFGLALTGLTTVQASPPKDSPQAEYEYIVVGSGPGGAPLAANLARAGHTVLLLEAGDDQGQNANVTNIFSMNAATNDPSTRWDFFVRHSDNPARELKYEYMVWRKKDGSFYVGTSPPKGAKQLGIWYPRAGTLGGCAMHNAGISTVPRDEDWDYIAKITGDETWEAKNMYKYLQRIENAVYAPNDPNHGQCGYLTMSMLPPITFNGSDGRRMVQVIADAIGQGHLPLEALVTKDPNSKSPLRDQQIGLEGIVRHANGTLRVGTNTYLRSTLADPRNFPLTVQLNSLVSKVLFSKSKIKGKHTAIGVEYLHGKSLYSADPRYNPKVKGETRRVYASREVILAAGVINTPQLLKLSGIGPAAELRRYKIPILSNLPGVGAGMADNYETSLVSLAARNLTNTRGTHAVMLRSSQAPGKTRDLFLFCGQFVLEGYWPGFPNDYGTSEYECAVVHMGPRSRAGTVELRSANPRDTPDINFNFFQKGGEEDLTALLDGIKFARAAFAAAPDGLAPWKEVHPCAYPKTDCSDHEEKEWIKHQAYSHHATSTCQIGGESNRMAVLDSKFRVRGVRNLRVVDGSAFPQVPGAFPVLPTFILSEKATESILEDL